MSMDTYRLSRRQWLKFCASGLLLLAAGRPARAFAAGDAARPLIIGVKGTTLSPEQKTLLREIRPTGIILYRFNIVDKPQLKALTASLREVAGEDTLIMIDSEGGKIVRLKPPHWTLFPGAAELGYIASKTPDDGKRATWLTYRLMAHQLAEVGINTNVAPVLDLRHGTLFSHADYRSFGENPLGVAALARIACEATFEGGVLPVIKHMPGQGRVEVNTDLERVHITQSLEELEKDISIFRALKDMPLAMSSNVVFDTVDKSRPASLSPAMGKLIRGNIGYEGVLMTDDLGAPSMLVGNREGTLRTAEEAGNDLLQYTFGLLDGDKGRPYLPLPSAATTEKIRAAHALARERFKPCDAPALQAELDTLRKRHEKKHVS